RRGQPDLPTIQKPGFTAVQPIKDRHSPYFETVAATPAVPIEPRFLEASRDYVTRDLASGQLVWARNPRNDLVQGAFTLDVGTETDPKLQTACALLDFGGAGDLDPIAFERKLFGLGTTISVGASRQETVVTVAGLDSNLEESLALMRAHFDAPNGITDKTY